jgi:hypothetical protein
MTNNNITPFSKRNLIIFCNQMDRFKLQGIKTDKKHILCIPLIISDAKGSLNNKRLVLSQLWEKKQLETTGV